MANYKTHLNFSGIISLVVSLIFYSINLINLEEAVISFALGAIGGFLPDIDLSYSKAIKNILNILFFLIAIITIKNTIHTHNMAEVITYIGIIYIVLYYPILEIFQKYTSHRGLFHSIPVALICAMITIIISNKVFKYNYISSYVNGISILIGYISHLVLDEIYSVNFKNKRIKKSLGSALKFGIFKNKKDKLYTFLIYLLLLITSLMLPNIDTLRHIYHSTF